MLLQRYAKAWIRLHTANDVRLWTPEEVLDTFCLLPQPSVAPRDWLELRQAIVAEPAPQPMTQEDVFAANAANIEGARADAKMMPDFITVKEANA